MQRINNLTNELITEEKVSKETLQNSKISNDFLIKYNLSEEMKDFFINSFQMLGWADPFPDDDRFIKGSLDDLGENMTIPTSCYDWVYPKSRYIEN